MSVKTKEFEVNKESSGFVNPRRTYKPSKTLEQQIEHLKNDKRVVFNEILEDAAKDILLRYNYINVIRPFKYHLDGKTLKHSIKIIDWMIADIDKYVDVYYYFDRLSLGSCLKIFKNRFF